MKRIIFLLIDGFADLVKRNTPLRIADKKFINSLSEKIHLSYIYPVKKKNWPPKGNYSVSGIANLSLLGYEVKTSQFKRGPYEAIGSGINFKNGWLAFRANFATVDDNLRVIDRRAGRNQVGFSILTKKINNINLEIPFTFYHTSGHRGVLVFKYNLSDKISENDPYQLNCKIKKIIPLRKGKKEIKTAEILNKFLTLVHQTLKYEKVNKYRKKNNIPPANYLLLREPGNKILNLENFFKKYKLKNGIVIASNGVDKGTCLSVGFKKYDLPYPKNIENELTNIKSALIKNYNYYQLIYCHLKKADEISHDKNFNGKKKFFEKFDLFLKDIFTKIKNDIIVVTGDHITSVIDGQHKFGPVPLIIINSRLTNKPKEISEIEALKLGRFFMSNNQLWNFLRENVS